MAAGPGAGTPNFLHLALDTQFIPFAIKCFETAFPGANQIRIADPGRGPLRFLQPADSLRRVPLRYWSSAELAKDLAAADCLVVHFMTPWFAKAVAAAPPSMAVVWGAWGGDFYHLLPDFAGRLHLPETARLVDLLRRRAFWSVNDIIGRVRAGLLALAVPPLWDGRGLGRIDAATMLPAEHRMLAAAHPEFHAEHHHFQYYSAEDTLLKGPQQASGTDILVGNSAFPNNNHLEAFALLRRLELGGRRIVVPLGYGDAHYAEAIRAAGKRSFGARFIALPEFMPLEEFNRELCACSLVLMNHVRQQGFGTINAAMVRGAKVYLRPENPLLEFYGTIGVRAFDMRDGEERGELLDPLDAPVARANRDALLDFCSYERAVQAVRGLARVVAGKRNAQTVQSAPHA